MAREPRTTRENETRQQSWSQPSLLPMPEPRDGWKYRWVRSAMLGKGDNVNVSRRFREGWEPVKPEEVPELKFVADHDSRFPEYIEIGGLILCKIPSEIAQQRIDHQTRMAQGQMEAVDRNFLRENNPRMPLLAPERKSRVTSFGED